MKGHSSVNRLVLLLNTIFLKDFLFFSQCFRSFTEQWALRKHERLHTGEKPYQCDVCKRYFADSSNLTKHKKIHLNSKLIKQVKIEEEQSINDTTAEGNFLNITNYSLKIFF